MVSSGSGSGSEYVVLKQVLDTSSGSSSNTSSSTTSDLQGEQGNERIRMVK